MKFRRVKAYLVMKGAKMMKIVRAASERRKGDSGGELLKNNENCVSRFLERRRVTDITATGSTLHQEHELA